jgi:hypothetical protein
LLQDTKVSLTVTVFDASQMSAFAVPGLSHEVRIRSIIVKEELSKWIIAGAGGGSVVVVGGLVVVVRKKHAQLEAIMAMLFTEVAWDIRLPLASCRHRLAALARLCSTDHWTAQQAPRDHRVMPCPFDERPRENFRLRVLQLATKF